MNNNEDTNNIEYLESRNEDLQNQLKKLNRNYDDLSKKALLAQEENTKYKKESQSADSKLENLQLENELLEKQFTNLEQKYQKKINDKNTTNDDKNILIKR